jgi:uncharacterized protein YyaL (SSP411 family)
MAEATPFSTPPLGSAAGIPWREWDVDLFADPALAGRLRLLWIAPAWHPELAAFEERAFAGDRIHAQLSAHVTPIRVDADEYPDVTLRYGRPDHPALALTSPDGEPLQRFADPDGEALAEAIAGWLERWREDHEEVLAELEAERVLRQAQRPVRRGDLTPALLDIALERAAEAPGLPGPERLRLWLYAHRRRGDVEAERRARMAIQRRIDGSGYDHAAGAFRHCAEPDPTCNVRLAEDQGRWLAVLARIAAEDSEAHEWVGDTVAATIDFVERELLNSSGAFTVTEHEARVLSSANAWLARGLLACGIVFDRSDWRSRGRTAVDFLVRRMTAGEAGYYHSWDGVPRTLGLLGAQVATAHALIDAYEVSGAADYLQHAQTVARLLVGRFQTAEGTIADADRDYDAVGLLDELRTPLLDQAEAAEFFIRLSHLTHDDRYVEASYAILGAVVGGLEGIDVEAASALARVADRLLSIEPEVKIIAFAPPGEVDSIADPLHAEALRLALAASTVQRLSPTYDDALIAQLGVPVTGGGALWFIAGEYGPLLTHPDELLPSIERALTPAG